MKVVHLNEHLTPKGGVETYLLAVLPLLAERGVESDWVFGRGDATLWPPSRQVEGMGAIAYGEESRVRLAVLDQLRDIQPDVVHIHNVQNLGVVQAAFDYGPTVVTTHDYRGACPANDFYFRRTATICDREGAGLGCIPNTLAKKCVTPNPRFGLYYLHRATWLREHAGRYAAVIAPSEGAAERHRRAGYPAERLTVLPYFCPVVPLEEPRPLPAQPTLTYMGRLAANKGVGAFVDALGLLPAHVQGVLVGNLEGGAAASVRQQAEHAGCADRLTLRPWASRDEIASVFDATTVFVFPSLWPETLGIVGLEALSRGVPVIASDVGGVREWLLDGETGSLVPPGDAGAIAEAARAMLAELEHLRTMGERGIAHIRDRFLPAHHADRLAEVYRWVANA